MDLTTKAFVHNEIHWSNDEFSESLSTEVPSVFESNENTVVTIVIVALAVILTIILLFGMAVFIDCRHQKLVKNGKSEETESRLFRLPNFLKFRRFSNEEDSIVEKMYEEGNAIA